ncbi:hypothetical protein SAMN04488543_1017 [Friedmanniella luteola]|uniref:Uncharacterized protein n=1 Tax=Friedmanniella luteola TaxID=546871 RepID=A0A1H1P9Z7_9ACTN|nr:hypothetical protein [Friedmanniella luteola]SDS07449.1 hypothetical protein SAMN04488543_1017 [Friedmanniella luteola]
MNGGPVVYVLLGLLLVGVVLGVLLLVRRHRYVASLRERGWAFESAPSLESVLDHHAPPFGLGLVRAVDEGIAGTTRAGVPFRVFEYEVKSGGPRFDARLASLRLPATLPDLFVSAGPVRAGVRLPAVPLDPALQVHAADPGYARALLSPAVLAALAAFGRAGHPVDVSVDGAQLVAVGAPKDPDALQAYLEALAPVVLAVDPAAVAPWSRPPVAPGFTFHGRPDWVLVGSDDSAIARFGLTTAGFGHTTEQVVRGDNGGLPVEGLVHRWKTHRTETSTDSQGRSQTRTVTEHHDEVVAGVWLPFALPQLSVDGGWGGERIRFESEEFNDRFKVRSASARLAYDVIHPRTMEFLMAVRPPGLRIEGNLMRFLVSSHDTETLAFCADFAHDFLARVPSFVWKNLQISPPAFRVDALTAPLPPAPAHAPLGAQPTPELR